MSDRTASPSITSPSITAAALLDVSDQFAPTAATYLDTASYGLPNRATTTAVADALDAWQRGSAKWFADWDPVGENCRRLFASLIGTAARDVALVPAVSVAVSLVMSGFAAGQEVLMSDDEFNSVTLPLEAAALERGVALRRVPYQSIISEVRPNTALVAVSHVRSNGGGTLDLPALAAAAHAHSAAVLLDATHSAGIRAIEVDQLGLDFVVAAAYKHLLCPRGVAFLSVGERWHRRLIPRSASWRGQLNPYRDYYGGHLDVLADGAARFDVSLDWHAWIGARPALELLDSLPTTARQSHCTTLADTFAAQLGVPATGTSITAVPVRGDRDQLGRHLDQQDLRVTVGDGTLRVSFHLYNTLHDVDRAVEIVRPLLDPERLP